MRLTCQNVVKGNPSENFVVRDMWFQLARRYGYNIMMYEVVRR